MESLRFLIGSWSGSGVEQFPTLPTFDYREHLVFEWLEPWQILRYAQRAQKREQGTAVWLPSHVELGLIKADEQGGYLLYNCQNSRVEWMHGNLKADNDEWVLDWQSLGFGGDPRMQAATRRWRFQDHLLFCDQAMCTDKVPTVTAHLSIQLARVDSLTPWGE
ncbi:MAG: FABP family protein [Acidobacteria bacterium]|nr:FABP family protein [Acidobacteriota bacterium]